MAGTIGSRTYGFAKNADLVGVRVLNCQGSGSYSAIIAGMDWVADNARKPAVANMSLGGGSDSSVDDAADNLMNCGVALAVASGNNNADACNYSPAGAEAPITVNSTDSNDSRSSFSNYGRCTDIFAPGRNITSTWIGSDTDTNTISGTSMATPHVAGAAALHLGLRSNDSMQEVKQALIGNATDGVVANPGFGSPNRLLDISYLNGDTPPQEPSCDGGSNSVDAAIPDRGQAVSSSLTLENCTGTGTAATEVAVSIKHPYTADLRIDLIAPSGAVTNLEQPGGPSTVDLSETYTVDTSTEDRSGTWTLRVQDAYFFDSGSIDSFGLTF